MGKNSQNISGNNNQQAMRDIINIDYLEHKLPSKISLTLPRISEAIDKVDNKQISFEHHPQSAYDIEEKIKHNDLKKYRPLVESYGTYRLAVESTYDALDDEYPGIKNKILRHLRYTYDLKKSDLLSNIKLKENQSPIDIIRQNSDFILDNVLDSLRNELITTKELSSIEDLGAPLMVVVCHGFISCKILEEPRK